MSGISRALGFGAIVRLKKQKKTKREGHLQKIHLTLTLSRDLNPSETVSRVAVYRYDWTTESPCY